jgi:hypothetical protein
VYTPPPNSVAIPKLIITVKEARKLLGVDAKELSDSQVEEEIVRLTSIAEEFLQNDGSKVK